MKIYMIRHGQTEWNKSGRLQGQTDIALNENGRELAAKVGQALKRIPFDRVISSPLIRSVETAQLVLAENEGKAGKMLRSGCKWKRREEQARGMGGTDLVLTTDERIKEIGFGEYEGYSVPSSSLFRGEEKYAITDPGFRNFFDAPEKYIPPRGGEGFDRLMRRTGAFLEELSGEESWKEDIILVSTHGAAVRALLANIKHTERKDFWKPGVPKNCAVSIAEMQEGRWRLLEQDVIYY